MRKQILRVIQWVVAAAFIAFAIYGIAIQWDDFSERVVTLDIHWPDLIFATVIVYAVYGSMIETWRQMLVGWVKKIPFRVASRIWFASGLGKYVPGSIWALTAMGFLSRQYGVSGIAAAGSAVIVNVLNLASGMAVLLLCGSNLLPQLWLTVVFLIAILCGSALLPYILPWMVKKAASISGRDIPIPSIPNRTIWGVFLVTGIAWICYGIAFRYFTQSLLGIEITVEQTIIYIGVYTGAYIVGLLSTPVAAAGIGPREAGITGGLVLLGLLPRTDALFVAFASRLWLTVLEVVPGIIALLISKPKIRSNHV